MQIKEKQIVGEKFYRDLWEATKEITLIGCRNNNCNIFFENLLYRGEYKNEKNKHLPQDLSKPA